MISFRATADEIAFIEVAKDFATEKIRPMARSCETNETVDTGLVNQAKELGFLGLEFPEDWGGLELPLITQAQIWKALSYGDLGVVQGFPGAGDAASLFRLIPNHEGLQSLRADFENGVERNTVLIDLMNTDKPFSQQITLQRNGSDYVLSGTTEPIRLGALAEIAVIFAKDEEGEAVILLLEQQEWKILNGDYRLGLLAAGLRKLSFEGSTIPKNHVLTSGKEAEEIIRSVRTRNAILEAAKQNGLMEAALEYATEYTAARKAFGQEIAKFQGVSFKIAKMAMETRIVNHLTWEAALKADEGSGSAHGFALRAIYRAHRGVRFVTDSAVQLLGGHGFIQEFPVEKWMRDAQAQVALYGRERDFLVERGEQLIQEAMEVTVK